LKFTTDCLKINVEQVVGDLCDTIRHQIHKELKKGGAVIGISGGVDSSVCAALCVRALGADRVLGVIMPEADSSPESEQLAYDLASRLGMEVVKEDITGSLTEAGCYKSRDEAIKRVFPEYREGWKSKIVIPSGILQKDTYNIFQLVLEDEKGKTHTSRMPIREYLQVVAASNLKQRLRMATLYYHAEKRNYAVIGTGNKDEHLQGFFVKYGDGGADLKPIASFFKVQVFQLAKYLDLPGSIVSRTPTTDTYSAEVTQEEFFFGLDFYTMDMLWYAIEQSIPVAEAAEVLGLTVAQVENGYANIERKIKATEYLRMPPLDICFQESWMENAHELVRNDK
jgi:NAD+ synthase